MLLDPKTVHRYTMSSRGSLMINNHAKKKFIKGGHYTPPHIPVGLRMDSSRLQMDFCCSSTIFSNFFFGENPAKCQPRVHLDSSWSPGPPSGLHGLHLITQSTGQTPYGVQQESTIAVYLLLLLLDKEKKCHDPELNTQSLGQQ